MDQAVGDCLLSQLITRPAALGLAPARFSPTFLLGNISGGAGPESESQSVLFGDILQPGSQPDHRRSPTME